MILDTFENAKLYQGIHPGIDLILQKLQKINPENFPDSKVFLDGDNVYMNPARYETKEFDPAKFEAHKLYADIMCMIQGEETIYVKRAAGLRSYIKEYDPAKDVYFADFGNDSTAVHLKPGEFCILFPQDAHAPGCMTDKKENVLKIIGKVKL